jgi:hypothetical protein
MAQSEHDDVNRLLARWGELLKVRHELRGAGMTSYRIIYSASWNSPEQHYDAELGHFAEGDALYEAFIKNIEENLDGIERHLKTKGVTVERPMFER